MRPEDKGLVLTEEQVRRRRQRNIAVALSLLALIVLFYVITIFKLGGAVAQRGL
ncbi:hypothetical protein [Terrihabitans rhizophilus]|jgi:predicted nucleic acid-binding Zn ribbon protein|uniref:CoxF protein n=1 Tax=Terrihabitans rhizophilus TaxID=3092662 RepID=A0ABU4RR48_9HYPH|nr:hypothetical protein [Terrihabitans sp. PJ23]MDX6807314.1 hypothetical protein [Terrihabitans sp. PJ23]